MRERLMAAALIAALSATPSVAQDKPAGPAAQEKAPAPAMQPSGGQVPLRVTVVISRLQGDKKIASLPYSFGMLAGERTNLRMGSDVPIISRRRPCRSASPPAPECQLPPCRHQHRLWRHPGTGRNLPAESGDRGLVRPPRSRTETGEHCGTGQRLSIVPNVQDGTSPRCSATARRHSTRQPPIR